MSVAVAVAAVSVAMSVVARFFGLVMVVRSAHRESKALNLVAEKTSSNCPRFNGISLNFGVGHAIDLRQKRA